MAISIRQALREGDFSGPANQSGMGRYAMVKPTERLLIEKTLMQMYPRLQMYDLVPWKWLNGPLIPDFLVRQADAGLRRIVEIGCGDGVFTNLLALLYPDVEIIGIDTDAGKIADARATVSYRQNLKFVQANAAVLTDIPCDRIIYNNCLSRLENTYAFKKLILKTSQWLVDEGDFLIKESPFSVLTSSALVQELLPRFRQKGSLEACIRQLLSEIGYSPTSVHQSKGLLGIPSQLYMPVFKQGGALLPELPVIQRQPVTQTVQEWQDFGEQSNDSLLGFLFSEERYDFAKELV